MHWLASVTTNQRAASLRSDIDRSSRSTSAAGSAPSECICSKPTTTPAVKKTKQRARAIPLTLRFVRSRRTRRRASYTPACQTDRIRNQRNTQACKTANELLSLTQQRKHTFIHTTTETLTSRRGRNWSQRRSRRCTSRPAQRTSCRIDCRLCSREQSVCVTP